MSDSKSFQLFKLSWRVLASEKQLLILPALFLILQGAVVAVASGFYYLTGAFERVDIGLRDLSLFRLLTGGSRGITPQDIAAGAAFYLLLMSISMFGNAALFAAAHERLQGRPASIRAGVKLAASRLPELLGWTFFSATVGMTLEAMRSGSNPVLKLIGLVLGIAWGFMTFFVVPVLVVEGLTPHRAVRRSTELLTQTWGEQLKSRIGFGLIALPLGFLLVAPLFVYLFGGGTTLTALTTALAAPVAVGGITLLSAMGTLFLAALYVFATTAQVSPDYPDELVREAYTPKKNS